MGTNLNSLIGNLKLRSRRAFQLSPVSEIDDVEDIVDEGDHDQRDLIKLLIRMRDRTIRSPRGEWILEECKQLFRADYKCKYVDNLDNNIPGVHPKLMFIPVAEKEQSLEEKRMNYDAVEYLKQEQESSMTSRTRFPCPVILFNGKYVCRSKYPSVLQARSSDSNTSGSNFGVSVRRQCNAVILAQRMNDIKKVTFAGKDVEFLKSIGVSYLIDLTNSTECDFKRDIMSSANLTNIYGCIEMSSMPYPREENFNDSLENIEETTKKCLLRCLQILVDGKGGLLVQSFNGGFRASLFTSLLRLSMWADGVIHKNLRMSEIAFLTLGYDWYLFGCRIDDDYYESRKAIEFFFNFLSVISSDDFSITRMMIGNQHQTSSILPAFQASRREILKELSHNLLECYNKSTDYIINSFAKDASE